ncbi:MAG: OmpA family protein [Bacteroidales bacterium]|nr:OmpA family protein [Candidatus Cryptobacteroides onthequi]
MKNIRMILCTAAALVSMTAFAQENNNRDAKGKVVRGPYETNSIGSNWFISVAGGASAFLDNHEGYEFGHLTPALDVTLGKWLTPSMGLRAGYQGLVGAQDATKILGNQAGTTTYEEDFKYSYVHGDLLWNISNAIGGYKETRLWNFIPYVHTGYVRLTDINDESTDFKPHATNLYDNEVALGVGLLNNIRLANRVNAFIDVRYTNFSSRFHDWAIGGRMSQLTGFIGLSYNIGKTNWQRIASNAASLALAEQALANAQAQIAALKAAPKDTVVVEKFVAKEDDGDTKYVPLALGIPPITLFFEINSTELNVTERQHLKFYVENILNLDPERKFYLTGSADKGTGTQSINEKLSQGRVEKVIEILKNEYGVSDDRLILKGTKITDEAADPRLDRSVIIVH